MSAIGCWLLDVGCWIFRAAASAFVPSDFHPPQYCYGGRVGSSAFVRTSAFGLRLSPLLALLLLSACRSAPSQPPLSRFDFSHPAMGTLITITLFASDSTAARDAAAAAFKRIDALEDIMSDYQADSELMRLCDQPFGKPVPVSPDLFDVLQRAQRMSQLSDGAFDVTVGPYVRLWRFARKRKVLPTPAEIAAARAAVGWQKLRLDPRARTVTLLVPNMRLDLGSIGKGYAADQAMRVLQGRGIDRALVAASGDIAIGNPPAGTTRLEDRHRGPGRGDQPVPANRLASQRRHLHLRRHRAIHRDQRHPLLAHCKPSDWSRAHATASRRRSLGRMPPPPTPWIPPSACWA